MRYFSSLTVEEENMLDKLCVLCNSRCPVTEGEWEIQYVYAVCRGELNEYVTEYKRRDYADKMAERMNDELWEQYNPYYENYFSDEKDKAKEVPECEKYHTVVSLQVWNPVSHRILLDDITGPDLKSVCRKAKRMLLGLDDDAYVRM